MMDKSNTGYLRYTRHVSPFSIFSRAESTPPFFGLVQSLYRSTHGFTDPDPNLLRHLAPGTRRDPVSVVGSIRRSPATELRSSYGGGLRPQIHSRERLIMGSGRRSTGSATAAIGKTKVMWRRGREGRKGYHIGLRQAAGRVGEVRSASCRFTQLQSTYGLRVAAGAPLTPYQDARWRLEPRARPRCVVVYSPIVADLS